MLVSATPGRKVPPRTRTETVSRGPIFFPAAGAYSKVGASALVSPMPPSRVQAVAATATAANTASTLAIDPETGVIKWHYQTTPHDGWDFDGVNEFIPFDATINGKPMKLGAKADKLQVIFVSVDPARDKPEILQAYMANFDPSFLALRGSDEELATMAKDFKIHYKKVDGLTPETYTMDHTAGVFLFRADGRFASIIDYHEDRRFALPKIRRVLT